MNIFDRALKSIQRNRIVNNLDLAEVYYYELGIKSLVDRLQSITNKQYASGCFIGPLAHKFVDKINAKNFLGLKNLTIVDNCKKSLDLSMSLIPKNSQIRVTGLYMDDENWGFPDDYFDLVVNNLQMHWLNKVHPTAEKWLGSLRPDGTLIGTSLGGDTLQELRISLALAEQERESGVSTHVSPMLHITDIGQVLIRLNYKLVTINADSNTLYFDDSFSLMNFIQNIGEGNSALGSRQMLSKETFIAADAIYRALFCEKSGEFQGKIPATFELVHYIGWKDHPTQQKPLKPGTKGVDIRKLAEEIDDSDMEQLEITENDNKVEVKNIKTPKK